MNYLQHNFYPVPFNLINPVEQPKASVLYYTFPTFLFRNFEEYFVPRKGVVPVQRWEESEQAMYIERLIRRKETNCMILREIKSTVKPNTHTVFEVWDGWQRILAMRAFRQTRVQDTLHLQKSICSISACRSFTNEKPLNESDWLNTDTDGMRIYHNFSKESAIAYDIFTMAHVSIIIGVPNQNDPTHETLAEQTFQKLSTGHFSYQNVAFQS